MENKPNRLVLVVFEDDATRDVAVTFCDALMRDFWAKCEFDVEWCSFMSLRERQHATKSAQKAAEADLIVFATQPEGLLPAEVRHWADTWIQQRGDREGVLVGLLDPVNSGGHQANKYTWIRGVARRAGLNYLTQAPKEIETVYVSSQSSDERASRVTSVLDEILHRRTNRSATHSAWSRLSLS